MDEKRALCNETALRPANVLIPLGSLEGFEIVALAGLAVGLTCCHAAHEIDLSGQ